MAAMQQTLTPLPAGAVAPPAAGPGRHDPARRRLALRLSPWLLASAAALAAPAVQAQDRLSLQACRLPGLGTEALCGTLPRPLDPQAPEGTQIDLHVTVLPAVARNKKPDAVMFFAGGPGQAASELAPQIARLLSRLSNRRDIVLIDQRGTGRSAPLVCDDPPPTAPLAEAVDRQRMMARLQACREALQQLPHGDLRHYTTVHAVQDAEAVRQALGLAQVNLVGGSYGTRVALEYLRQAPQAVRRVVIDGVAPADMALPAAFSTDAQAAFDAVFAACRVQPDCAARYPDLRGDWERLLAGLPRSVSVAHPVTGLPERITLTRETVLSLVRPPMYAPPLAAGLPHAVHAAASGRFEPLLGLSSALGGGRSSRLAAGMHFSVICAEDLPRLAQAVDAPGADFGESFVDLYRDVCADWPKGEVPPAFYTLPQASGATLVLSGGADPATPPRHGERVAAALGASARHVVVPEAGHGLMALPCLRDVLFRFIDAADDAAALAVEADCARAIPRPGAFIPPGSANLNSEAPR
jgi:pimeloyl-ACP methyl ester carboxylesterase